MDRGCWRPWILICCSHMIWVLVDRYLFCNHVESWLQFNWTFIVFVTYLAYSTVAFSLELFSITKLLPISKKLNQRSYRIKIDLIYPICPSMNCIFIVFIIAEFNGIIYNGTFAKSRFWKGDMLMCLYGWFVVGESPKKDSGGKGWKHGNRN